MTVAADLREQIAPDILDAYPDLDEAKWRIIAHDEGPLLVIAGPGSGKTFSLVLRTINLLLLGRAKPSEIIVCTFTEKAAFELRDRISDLALQIRLANDVLVEASIKPEAWKGARTVDLAVRTARAKGWEAIAELKWWSGKNKVEETLWDAWKLAGLYRENIAPFVYLIAAGRAGYWELPLAQLWTEAAWPTLELWAQNPALHKNWVVGKYGPTLLPRGIRTHPIASVPIHSASADWRLGVVRITTTPGGAIEVAALQAASPAG